MSAIGPIPLAAGLPGASTRPRAWLQRYGPQASVVLLCLIFCAVLWTALLVQRQFERERIIESKRLENDNLVRVFEKHVARTIRAAEVTLGEMVKEYQEKGTKFDLVQYAKNRGIALDPYTGLNIIDEKGDLILGSFPLLTAMLNLSTTPDYRYHAQHDTPGIYISAPRLGVVTGKWTVFLSLRVNKADRSFGGYASIGMDPSYFSGIYAGLDLGTDSVVVLVGRDGIIRVRAAGADVTTGQNVSDSELFRRLRVADRGSYIARAPLDQITRIFAYHALKDYPLVVVIGTSQAVALSDLDQRTSRYVATAGGITLLILCLGLFTLFQIERSKRAQEELKTHSLVLHSMTEAVTYTDPQGSIRFSNPAFDRIFGYEPGELIGQPVSRLNALAPEENARLATRISETIRNGGEWDGEFLNRRKDGRLIHTRGRITGIRHKGETWAASVQEDITERKRAEESLRLLNGELEARVQERTRELVVSKDEAERASRAKSEFLATVSHELRTPLHAIAGFTEIAMYTPGLPAAVNGYLADVMGAAAILRRHIDDLLDASRLEYGKLPLVAAPFDLESCVQEVIEMLGAKAEAKGLELMLRFPVGAPRAVVGDAQRLRQVLTNLVDNAIRFTEAGHVLVEVNGRACGSQQAEFRIVVEDTGIGVPKTQRVRIFEKFSQANGSITRTHGGLGLGLALSRQIVELMGGSIELENTSGAGARFAVTLILPLDPQAWNEAPDRVPQLRDARVLIVADKALTAGILHEYVQGWRMRNGIVGTGEEALRTLRVAHEQGDPFRFAIIAVPLPDMSLEKLTGQLRADPGLRETLALMLLPAAGEHSPMPHLEAPIVGYLTRPVSPSQLLDAMVTVSAAWAARVAPDHKVLAPAARPGARTECRVLVVEDNTLVRRSLAMLLETALNCRVEVAENGAVGVTKAAAEDFDIIFMDLQMPLMDGITATKQIRALAQPFGRVPIVAFTAHASEAYRNLCLQAGMDGYVVKPAYLDDLRRALERWALKPATPAVGGEAGSESRDADRDGE